MRILFLNRSFPPDRGATGHYLSELTEDLSSAHDVSVVCGLPNAPAREGGASLIKKEQSGSVDVWRAWGTRWDKSFPLGRIINQASFFASATLASRRLEPPDVVVSLTDPPFLGLLGAHLKRRFGAPFVYYCEDLYPDVATAVDMAPGPLADAFERVQARILSSADRIVALSDDMAARLAAKGAAGPHVSIVRNWADTHALRPIKGDNPFRKQWGLDDRFVVMYSGNFGYVWDLDVVLDAAAALRDQSRIAFVLVGDGSTRGRVEARLRRDGLSNVRLLPYQPRERLSESLGAADLHLVPMRPGVYGTVVPSKIYGILAAGKPIAASAEPESEAARVVRTHRCGWHARPGDKGSLVEMIRSALRSPEQLQAMGARALVEARASAAA
jgi:glycosyltransferase involved in cell wall biosynthesis